MRLYCLSLGPAPSAGGRLDVEDDGCDRRSGEAGAVVNEWGVGAEGGGR